MKSCADCRFSVMEGHPRGKFCPIKNIVIVDTPTFLAEYCDTHNVRKKKQVIQKFICQKEQKSSNV